MGALSVFIKITFYFSDFTRIEREKRNAKIRIPSRSYSINLTLAEPNSVSIDRGPFREAKRGALRYDRYSSSSSYLASSSARACDTSARIESQAGCCSSNGENGLAVRFVRVLYRIVLSEYTFRTRVSPHPLRPTTARYRSSWLRYSNVHRAISGEIVERTGIKLYRISDSAAFPPPLPRPPPLLPGLAILELSVIDGPWRTYRLLTRSQNYPVSALLRVTARTKAVSENVRHDIRLAAWTGLRFLFSFSFFVSLLPSRNYFVSRCE